jgi:predicted DNA-binding transcriptional regulator AlpA
MSADVLDDILARLYPYDTSMNRPQKAFPKVGVAKSTGYLHVRQGLLTEPVRISEMASGWPAYELDAINCVRIAGGTDEDVRAMVRRLIELRQQLSAREPSAPVAPRGRTARSEVARADEREGAPA